MSIYVDAVDVGNGSCDELATENCQVTRPKGGLQRNLRVRPGHLKESGIKKPSAPNRELTLSRVFVLSKPNRESRRADSNRWPAYYACFVPTPTFA